MNWIKIEEIGYYKPDGNILVWQKNLSDAKCSRFQRASYCDTIIIYPLTNKTIYQKKDEYKNYDLEGICVN